MEVIKVWNKEENNKGGFRGTFEQKDIIENHYFEDEKVIFETIENKKRNLKDKYYLLKQKKSSFI